MALARVVTFSDVGSDRMQEMLRQMQGDESPEDVPATEMIVLHDPSAETATVVLFFDSDADYEQGDAVLSAMPSSETPGTRTSVGKYDVAFRMTS
jgi:hypothetical protein